MCRVSFCCHAYSKKQNSQATAEAGRARSTVDMSSSDSIQGDHPLPWVPHADLEFKVPVGPAAKRGKIITSTESYSPRQTRHQHPNLDKRSRRIVCVEGLDGTGKTSLCKDIVELYGSGAVYLKTNAPPSGVDASEFYKQENIRLSDVMRANTDVSLFCLDRFHFSGIASAYARNLTNEKDSDFWAWPSELVIPTHLIFVKVAEAKRMQYLSRRGLGITPEEQLSLDSADYRSRYEYALSKLHSSVRDLTLMQVIDCELDLPRYSINPDVPTEAIRGMTEIVNTLLDLDLRLLDPKNLTSLTRAELRPLYKSWWSRLEDNTEKVVGANAPGLVFRAFPQVPGGSIDERKRQLSLCHFANIDRLWTQDAFAEPRHPPYKVASVQNRDAFSAPVPEPSQVQDMPIKFPRNPEYRIPRELAQFEEVCRVVANFWAFVSQHSEDYFCYMSVSSHELLPWEIQRRPGLHCDGFQSCRHTDNAFGEYAFVISDAVPTVWYIESFDVSNLDRSKDDFFVHFSEKAKPYQTCDTSPYDIVMMDPYCLHSPATNKSLESVQRTFIRLMFSTREYDRAGNHHNALFDYSWKMEARDQQTKLRKATRDPNVPPPAEESPKLVHLRRLVSKSPTLYEYSASMRSQYLIDSGTSPRTAQR
jgi:thymidylate kinase